jgi:acylphosphatase
LAEVSDSEFETTSRPDVPAVVSRRLLIGGLVQGVGFRVSLAQRAENAGLVGQVRNLDDGRVEAVLQGPRAAVEGVQAWCHHGPTFARVQSVEASETDVSHDTSFVISD